MKKANNEVVEAVASVEETTVNKWTQPRTIVSDKLVDYENLTAFEAVSMSLVFVLAVTAGVVTSMV